MRVPQQPPSIDPKIIEKLKELFYSDEFGMRGINAFYKLVQKEGIDISFRELKKGFYDLQEVVQMFAPLKKVEASKVPIKGKYTGERVYFDTMYFPKVAIINAFDLHSKYAWGKPIRLKTRSDGTTESVDSRKTASFLDEVIEAFHKQGFTVDTAVSDSGTEFMGDFRKRLEEEGIPHETTEPGDHLLLGPIDGYTRGLRLAAEKWLAVNPGADLYKQVPKLIELYNNSPHSTIKMTPSEALGKVTPISTDTSDDREPITLQVGDSVRVVTRFDKNPFNKIRHNYSREIYTIKRINPTTRRFEVSNGKTYREQDLFHVKYPDRVMRYEPPARQPPPESPDDTAQPKTPLPPREPSKRERISTFSKYLVNYV